jgi:hypothetical protein
MSVSWPAILPQKFLVDGYKETPPDNTVRHDPDGGAALARKKYTAAVGKISGAMSMTAAQVAILDNFYATYGGFTEFIFPNPRTGAAMNCRMLAPPDYSADGIRWQALLSLEVLV